MDRSIITQRITFRSLRGDYGCFRPTTQAIGKIGEKFKETGVITNIERPVHQRFARTAENIAIVRESVAADQKVSIPRLPHE